MTRVRERERERERERAVVGRLGGGESNQIIVAAVAHAATLAKAPREVAARLF
jgi:hypothetical protein